jgi:prophage antirepressor-like protein
MQKNQIQTFSNKEFGELEVLLIGDKPYFPATECAKTLGYKTPHDAITRHCKGCVKHVVLSNGGEQRKNFIPEGDLYRLIVRSKLPAAVKFEVWVFDEVLPTIRKCGGYVTNALLDRLTDNPEEAEAFFKTLKEERAKNKSLENLVTSLIPKAQYHDMILQCEDAIPISVIAKDYGMSGVMLNRLLHEAGVQYRRGGTWLLYKDCCNRGYTLTRTYPLTETTSAIHTYWTQKGRRFIYEVLKLYGILPEAERGSLC